MTISKLPSGIYAATQAVGKGPNAVLLTSTSSSRIVAMQRNIRWVYETTKRMEKSNG